MTWGSVIPFTRRPKRHPSHAVPSVGTLAEISYCAACGMAFDDPNPCRMTCAVPIQADPDRRVVSA